MVSKRRSATPAKRESLSDQLKLLLLVNALPLAGIGYLGWRLYTGSLKLSQISERLPGGGGESLVVILFLFGVLIALVGVPLSILDTLLRRLARRGIVSVVEWSNAGFVRKLWEIVLWLPRTAVYILLWIIRTAVLLTILATLALMLVFLVRLVSPEFGNDWLPIERVLARIR